MSKILIAEDDKFLISMYGAKLTQLGVEVVLEETGTNVLTTALKEKPNLIILDIVMPVKDGFEVIQEVRNNDKTSGIPLIVITALDVDREIQSCLEMGATEVIIKMNSDFSGMQKILSKYLPELKQ